MTRRNSSAEISANGANTEAIALLIHTSIGPNAASTSLAAASTESASATSSGRVSALPPSASTSLAVASSPSLPRAISPMLAPSRAKARTAARPTPAEAPVTTTTSDRFIGIIGS